MYFWYKKTLDTNIKHGSDGKRAGYNSVLVCELYVGGEEWVLPEFGGVLCGPTHRSPSS